MQNCKASLVLLTKNKDDVCFVIRTHPRVFLLRAQRDRKLVQVSKSYTQMPEYMEKRKIRIFHMDDDDDTKS